MTVEYMIECAIDSEKRAAAWLDIATELEPSARFDVDAAIMLEEAVHAAQFYANEARALRADAAAGRV